MVSVDEEGEDAAAAETPAATPAAEPDVPKAATSEAPLVHASKEVRDKVSTAPPGNSGAPGAIGRSKALSTPAVRHLAKKEGIDINGVPGTGKNGRVTKTDILNFI